MKVKMFTIRKNISTQISSLSKLVIRQRLWTCWRSMTKELGTFARLLIATEDGSVGTKGNVLDAVREEGVEADVICACGPMPMLRAVKKYAAECGIPAYISLEERMACGVGACLGCVTRTAKVDAHSHVRNARICTEGPVFEAREVEIG